MSRKLTIALMALLLGVLQPGATVALRAQGPQEGIKVHGHWTIDVRNPDGTLAKHHEFENALVFSGSTLAQVLGHASAAGRWQISVGSRNGVNPCFINKEDGSIVPYTCSILESNSTAPLGQLNIFKTLTVGVSNGATILLNGTATAAQDGSIDDVATLLSQCPRSIAVDGCNDWSYAYSFVTSADLSAQGSTQKPISVAKGQIIQVQVVISFS